MNVYSIVEKKLQKQKKLFQSGESRSLDWRLDRLEILLDLVKKNEDRLIRAMSLDLGKSDFESYTTEILIVKRHLRHTISQLKKWSRPKVYTGDALLMGKKTIVQAVPRGQVLVIAPFNYPVQLSLVPIATALSAGNAVVLKPSEKTPRTSFILKLMLEEAFDDWVQVYLGDGLLAESLVDWGFDLIFFTGSQAVGQKVSETASKHFTPVILELGGKSPAVVCEDADLRISAKRIAWGKWLNGGQTCVAPDYVLVEESIAKEFTQALIDYTKKMYPDNEGFDFKYDDQALLRFTSYLSANQRKIVYGGEASSPSILFSREFKGNIMREEIFGPVLPVIPYKNKEDLYQYLDRHPYPLAFYLFTDLHSENMRIWEDFQFGGGMINDTVLHLVSDQAPFGGIRSSGIGHYHGEYGFQSFSQMETKVISSLFFEIPFILPPYGNRLDFIRKILF